MSVLLLDNQYRVKISESDYEACVKCSCGENFWGNSKQGIYGKGLCSSVSDKYKPARIGKLGEMAFSKIFGVPMDTMYRKGGDQYDFVLCNQLVDVKTVTKDRREGPGYVLYENEYGHVIPIDKDIYVFAYCSYDNMFCKEAEIIFLGYCLKIDLLGFPVRKGLKGNYKNIEVPFCRLRTFSDLLNKYINSK